MSQKQNDEPLDAPTPPGGPQRTDDPESTEGSKSTGSPGTTTDDQEDR